MYAEARLILMPIDTSNKDVDIMIGEELVTNELDEEIIPNTCPEET